MIITEAGMHPDVKSLVYVAAAQPDVGESLADLSAKMPRANKSIGPVSDGFLAVNPDAFPSDFAADAPKALAHFMAISQVPVAKEALDAKATVAAWKQKPSYAVVATQDRMINRTSSGSCRSGLNRKSLNFQVVMQSFLRTRAR
jgi:hypothetical protein